MSNLEESTEDAGGQVECDSREQDKYLPIANIIRIMKKALPNNAKVARDAKDTVQDCVSEFISFITSEASEKCQQEKRKTINGEDIIAAMNVLGFENYIEPLKVYLAKYRENEKRETLSAKKSPKKQQAESASQSPPSSPSLSSSSTTTTTQYQQQPQQPQPPILQQQQLQQLQQQQQQQQLDLSSGSTAPTMNNNMYLNQVPDSLDNYNQYYYGKQ